MSPQEELDALEVRKVHLQAKVAQGAHQPFPCMVYKDLEGDGDVSSGSNQHTVKDQAELDMFLKDGWSQDPNDAAKKPDVVKPESLEKRAERVLVKNPHEDEFGDKGEKTPKAAPKSALSGRVEAAKLAGKDAEPLPTFHSEAAKSAQARHDAEDRADEAKEEKDFEKASDRAASKRKR